MSETHTLILALNLSTPINQMNVFEIGHNKKRINIDELHNSISRNIPNRIKQLELLLKRLVSEGVNKELLKLNLAIPSYILEVLIKKHKESYLLLKSLASEYEIKFLLTTYYSSSLRALSEKELSLQLSAEKKLLKKYFGSESNIFFPNDHAVSKKVFSALDRQGVKGIIFATNGKSSLVNYSNSLIPMLDPSKDLDGQNIFVHTFSFYKLNSERVVENLKKIILDNAVIDSRGSENCALTSNNNKNVSETGGLVFCEDIFSSLNSRLILTEKEFYESYSPMELKLLNELQMIYPHIDGTGDKSLIDEWRFLANRDLIRNANPNMASDDHSPYEYFVNFMNVLNDMAPTIRSIRAVESGDPLPKFELVNNPSEILSSESFNNRLI